MTAKTTRNTGKDDAAEEAALSATAEGVLSATTEGVSSGAAEVVAEDDLEAGRAREETRTKAPAKKKRRVRVIEVIEDDDDLDEVLEAIESGELLEEEPEPEPTPEKPAAKQSKPKSILADEEKAAEPEAKAVVQKASSGGGAIDLDAASGSSGFSMSRNAAIVTVVVVALLASLGIWQWTSASKLSGDEHARDDVGKAAAAYGDAVFTYNSSNYQGQMDKVQKMLAGDLLDLYKRCTVPNLGDNFKSNPGLSLTSRTSKVFVGDVDGKFATATIATDITVQSSQGSTSAPASLIRLSLAKSGGGWKVTQQFPSGVNQQSNDCSGSNQIPVSPNGQNGQPGTGKPSSTPSAKPSN
ncbi:hypothetical protein [Actinomadura oligospora]|uniref:hypothetical protein n=1 Tax=Actinomadura oligospora TaxID=111804 RepID=UPI00047EEF36|nr:hypothetical protein [Actinomadura oligospora]